MISIDSSEHSSKVIAMHSFSSIEWNVRPHDAWRIISTAIKPIEIGKKSDKQPHPAEDSLTMIWKMANIYRFIVPQTLNHCRRSFAIRVYVLFHV